MNAKNNSGIGIADWDDNEHALHWTYVPDNNNKYNL